MSKNDETTVTTKDVSGFSDFLIGTKTSEATASRDEKSETARDHGATKESADRNASDKAQDKLNR